MPRDGYVVITILVVALIWFLFGALAAVLVALLLVLAGFGSYR